MINRRTFLAQSAGLLTLGVAGRRAWLHALPAGAAEPVLTIYKSSTCTCCAKWVDHVKAAGFKTVVHERENMDEVKAWLGVPSGVHSCHTGQVGSYLIEGHVPAADIRRLLAERPKVAGLAVPGMPKGTPGMEIPGQPADRYEVVSFQRDGATKVFARR